jgi:hypothetical protein
MLRIEIHEGVVFCHYSPDDAGPNNGDYLGRVYEGGSFKGLDYDELVAIGTGEWKIVLDEREENVQGNPPDWLYDDAAWANFCYEVGAITQYEAKQRKLEAMKLQVLRENPTACFGVPVDQEGKPLITAQMGSSHTQGQVMYFIDVPPPTISGKLHMGQIFSYAHMDFLARYYKLVKGEQLIYPFCFDNTGIPTEKSALENGITGLYEKVEFSEKVSKEYETLFRDMGMAFSYDRETFSRLAIDVADESFADLERKGLLYEDERDSLWCPKTQTWVSQSEVDEEGCYERSGEKVEVRQQHGWFVRVVDNLDRIRDAVKKIEWRPDHYQNRLLNWLDGYKYDWSISRERKFGVTLPAGVQENYVCDTWFISSLTPQIAYSAHIVRPTLDAPVFDARFQAHDIINTWALYTIIKSVFHRDDIPWKRIIISGHALTGDDYEIKDCVRFEGEGLVPNAVKYAVAYRDKANCWHATWTVDTPDELGYWENLCKGEEETFRFALVK